MFTGIVQEVGKVESVDKSGDGIRLAIRSQKAATGLKTGNSLAVNGCCLTAVRVKPGARECVIEFDLLRETWERTNLQFAKAGALVNLEPPLRADTPIDGHFVTGHIDGIGKIVKMERSGADRRLEISAPPTIMDFLVAKGSIAVDGISLTVAELRKKQFTVWIIPHTYEATALRERDVGDAVNLEADILGKYVAKFMHLGVQRVMRELF